MSEVYLNVHEIKGALSFLEDNTRFFFVKSGTLSPIKIKNCINGDYVSIKRNVGDLSHDPKEWVETFVPVHPGNVIYINGNEVPVDKSLIKKGFMFVN